MTHRYMPLLIIVHLESSSEDETSEDEAVTEETPKPRHELEQFVLVKHGKQYYLAKAYEVVRKVRGWR